MTGVLITFNFVSMAFLAWALLSGYQGVAIRTHILIALGATGFSVFSHSLTMMYFVAIGRMIREAVEKGGLDPAPVAETKGYRSSIFRMAFLAMTLVMLNTILAGGAHTRAFPEWIHHVLALLAVLSNAFVVYLEVRYLIANHLLGHRVARDYERMKDKG